MLFLCYILCHMSYGGSLNVECIFPFGMLCLSARRMMFVKMVYVWWWLNVSESILRVCSKLCPVCFPIVREHVSVVVCIWCLG